MKIDPNESCTCTHRRGVHLALKMGCMWGNHPDRNRDDFDQYRAMYDACPCPKFAGSLIETQIAALDTDELDEMTGGNPYNHD